MLWTIAMLILFCLLAYVLYTKVFHKESFASPEEKASFLIEKGAGADSFREFHERTEGGYNTDFYKMKKLQARGELNVPNLAKQL